MPGWHQASQDLRKSGQLQFVGITQEQHPERCQLFAQWHQFDWPILHDPINTTRATAVPITVAIDEHGIVRKLGPTLEWVRNEFVKTDYPAPESPVAKPSESIQPNIAALVAAAKQSDTFGTWRTLGDACTTWGSADDIERGIAAYQTALQRLGATATDGVVQAQEPITRFRLGVAYRRRFESPHRQLGDFQAAVTQWTTALRLDPNQYIWRRRIQQYGPRLDKPYPFYDWVPQAREAIQSRGEVPVKLPVEPSGAEIASPTRSLPTADSGATEPDAEGRLTRDDGEMVRITATVVPADPQPGQPFRLHLLFEPQAKFQWNNEVGGVEAWIESDPAMKLGSQRITQQNPRPAEVESDEDRMLEAEVQLTEIPGKRKIRGYATYFVCDDQDGRCLFRRQDFQVELTPEKPVIENAAAKNTKAE